MSPGRGRPPARSAAAPRCGRPGRVGVRARARARARARVPRRGLHGRRGGGLGIGRPTEQTAWRIGLWCGG